MLPSVLIYGKTYVQFTSSTIGFTLTAALIFIKIFFFLKFRFSTNWWTSAITWTVMKICTNTSRTRRNRKWRTWKWSNKAKKRLKRNRPPRRKHSAAFSTRVCYPNRFFNIQMFFRPQGRPLRTITKCSGSEPTKRSLFYALEAKRITRKIIHLFFSRIS